MADLSALRRRAAWAALSGVLDEDSLVEAAKTCVMKSIGTEGIDKVCDEYEKVLELAMSEARELNHSYVGTEHLLLGLLREEKGIAAQVLTDAGVNLDAARAETLRLLGTEMRDQIHRLDRVLGRLLDRLEQKGRVKRDPHPSDRRAKVPQITAEGRAALREAAPGVRRVQARLMAPLSAAERRAFEMLCRKLLASHHG